MKEFKLWKTMIIALAIILSTYIYVRNTRFAFSPIVAVPGGGAGIYKIDRSNGHVWLIFGLEQMRVKEDQKEK